MICFNCGLQLNTGEDRECRACGAKFHQKCSSCTYPNPASANFCFNCGTRLSPAGARTGSVHNFEKLTESRKNVAVIFADVSGFTSLSEKLDPEEVRDIINDCFNYITRPVYELEGTIDKYIGDCVMILFGAKYTHADDAKRAVICAMKMSALIREFSKERLSSTGFELKLSIGINFGLVVTGSVGNYFDKDYTVMGDIVNTAQRLQSKAEKGEILVSEAVYTQTRGMFEYGNTRVVSVKNKENAVRCYTPIKINNDFLLEREMFVERETEIGRLNSIYNSTLNTCTQCICVTGEAGVGKTRLIKEFLTMLGNDVKNSWVDCNQSYHNRIYYVISSILAGLMNINVDDSPAIKQNRLKSFTDYILSSYSREEKERNYWFISLVMSLDRDADFQSILDSMNFDSIRREILKQLNIFFVNLCRNNRVVIVCDDFHWADTGSASILHDLIPMLSGTNAVFIFTSRSETRAFKGLEDWRYHTLNLEALSEDGIKAIVCKVLDCKNIDREFLKAISSITKGNPLYIMEFVSNLKRTGKYSISGGTATIEHGYLDIFPGSIRSLILSTFSGLDDITRLVLQVASAIGREFSISMINYLLKGTMDENQVFKIPLQLNIMSLKGVQASSESVDRIYSFNHDIEREAIYESILNKNKRELHKNIGEYFEEAFSNNLEQYYDILAAHFHKAGQDKKAACYYYKTALWHKNEFSFNTALDYFGSFINLASHIQDLEPGISLAGAYREIGRIHLVTGNYDMALDNFQRGLSVALMNDDVFELNLLTAEVYKDKGLFNEALSILSDVEPKIRQDNILYGRLLQMKCYIWRVMGNPEALGLARKSEKILLMTKDYQSLADTMRQAGMIYFTRGDIDNALFYMSKSYKYAGKINNMELMARVSGDMGIVCHSTGINAKALDYFTQSLDISRKISFSRGYIAASINLGVLYLDKGLFNKAEELFKNSLDITRETESRLYECAALTNLGDIACERGLYKKAEECYLESSKLARDINAPVEEAINLIGIARVQLKSGFYDKAEENLESSGYLLREADEMQYMSDYYIYKGSLELLRDNVQQAGLMADKALETAEECRNDRKKLKARRLQGHILIKKKDYKGAALVFDQTVKLAQDIDSGYDIAKGYYGKYLAYSSMYPGAALPHASVDQQCTDKGQKSTVVEQQWAGEVPQMLSKAGEAIGRVDECRWSSLIREELGNFVIGH